MRRRRLTSRAASLVFLAAFLAGAAGGCRGAPPGIPLLPPSTLSSESHREVARAGRLVVLERNPRYFTDAGERRAIYLTGAHTWDNFQDWGLTSPPRPFDYVSYLDFLERHGHNFIRLYVWEQAAWFPGTADRVTIAPLPYVRTGPGRALDGGPRFDLTSFEPGYFRRLRQRVETAGARGLYVSVMLFNGWSVELKGQTSGNPWRGHPFNRENNINGIDGDTDGDGEGREAHTLKNPAITALQKAYLRKVVETLADLDNVLWEISNESHPRSVQWQYEMIRTLKALEAERGASHPVGMTSVWPHGADGNASLFESPADWISPHDDLNDSYKEDPPASRRHNKVVLSDTDHLWGIGGSPRWVWKTFLRGLNPLFMDPYVTAIRHNIPAWPWPDAEDDGSVRRPAPEWEEVRTALGYARALADRVELASMRPMGELASTGYCLAAPGKEYLIYVPFDGGWPRRLVGQVRPGFGGEPVAVDLSAARGALTVEWVDTERGVIVPADPVGGGQHLVFRTPFAADAVLHLKARDTLGERAEGGPAEPRR